MRSIEPGISRFRVWCCAPSRNDAQCHGLHFQPDSWDPATMSGIAFAVLSLGALAGGFVSGLAGFGTGLMALGIWLYVVPPSIAVPLVLICSLVGQTSTMPSLWRSIDFKLVWPFLVGGLAGVPLGTMLVAYADPQIFRLCVGALLLVFPTALYFHRRPIALGFGGKAADTGVGFGRRNSWRHGRFVRSDSNFVGGRARLGQGR